MEPSRDVGITIPTQESSNATSGMAVVDAEVVSIFLCFKSSWISLAYITSIALFFQNLSVCIFSNTIDFKEP